MTHRPGFNGDPQPRVRMVVLLLVLGLGLVGAARVVGALVPDTTAGDSGADPNGAAAASPEPTASTSPAGGSGAGPTNTAGHSGAGPNDTQGPGATAGDPGTNVTEPPVTAVSSGEGPSGSGVGEPWGSTVGLTMFRGNPTRTFYGSEPVPPDPSVLWSYPDEPMCSQSTNLGETMVWCGMGWTGQPAVWERPDGVTELIFGAYDRNVHFVDAATGRPTRPQFRTGDLIKGTVTLDPDGYPLLYFGSRDNKLRILALDRAEPVELWSMDAYDVEGIWNDDWDSNPAIVDDIMYEGGENGWFFAVLLNRGYDPQGQVTIDPELLLQMPGYDQELIDKAGENLSIENSVALYEQRAYFANSGGRVVGLDISNIRQKQAPIVFDYWAGGDIDATITIDAEGMLYVAVNVKPGQVASGYRTQANIDRTREVGQLLKLDPYTDGDPRVWGIDVTAGPNEDAGIWATPALGKGVVYVNTHPGELIAVDVVIGEVVWSDPVGWHSWSSPVIVDDTLVVATCTGELRAYSLADPRSPERLWAVPVGESCLEATPAVWDGKIYLGSRDGHLRAFGDG